MCKTITVFTLVLLLFSVAAAAGLTEEEVQALFDKQAADLALTPAEKAALENHLTNRQLLDPGMDTDWGNDGWYMAVDQYSGGQAFNWMDISATGTELWPGTNQDDTWSSALPLPFAFPHYGVPKYEIYVSANMILKFHSASPSYSTPVPSNTQQPRIDPWCYDMYHMGADTVAPSHAYYQAFGDSLFVVQFKGIRYYTTTYREDPTYAKDLQVLLYNDGRVVFQYDSLRNIVAGSPYNSGIDDSVGVAGLTCGNSFVQGQAITFTPLTGTIIANGQVTPPAGNTTTTFNYQVLYRNTDNLAPTSAMVYIDSVPYALVDPTMGLGPYAGGANFTYSTTLPLGDHTYYFEFVTGGSTYRFPATGTLAGPAVSAPFSGSYDIGGGLNDYPTILAAVDALAGAGLGGAVTFNVYNGTYDGQVYLPNTIAGLSETNTLTIQAATGQSPVVVNTAGTSSTTGNGFYVVGADYITIKGFEITNCYYSGVYVTYSSTDSAKFVTLENNYIHDVAATTSGYGIYVYRGVNCKVLNNEVQGDNYGIQIYYCKENLIANNLVYGQDAAGIRNYYGSNNKYYYNSVYLNSSATSSYAMYCYNSAGNEIKNNIFYNGGSGATTKYAFYLTGSLTTYPITSNYNDLYSPYSSVGYFTAARTTLADWQTATGQDANSLSADPLYTSIMTPYDLHISTTGAVSPVSNVGTPVTDVTVDFDYEDRHATAPDIGGDEFTLAAGVYVTNGLVDPASGTTATNFTYQATYTNSGNQPPTSAQVFIDDVAYTLVDPTGGTGNYVEGVTFTYTTLLPSGDHTYYFQFVYGGVTYRFPETGYLAGPSVVISFAGTYDIGGGANHYPTIVAAMTALGGGGLGGPVIFNVYNGTYDGQVTIPNTLVGLSEVNTLTFQAAPGCSPVVTNSTGASATEGNGFYILSADYVTIKGFEISGCYYAGVYVHYTGSDSAKFITVEDNYIHDIAPASTGYGIQAYRAVSSKFLNNEIQGDYYGIQIYYGKENLIANNLVYGQDYYGIRNYYGGNNKYYYNSVYLNSSYGTTNYAAYSYNSAGCEFLNNIFYNGGSGSTTKYAFYLSGALATYPITSNYNDLYAPNSSLGYYTAAQADLAAWQAATGLDANSMSADPNYVSVAVPYNLHIAPGIASPVSDAGTPVADVTVDFDYEARSATTPDLGGDEFTPAAGVFLTNGAVTPPTGNTTTNFVYQITYTHTDSLAPTSAQVFIDDVAYALVDSTGGTGAYNQGVMFYYTTLLPAGEHTYYFLFGSGGVTYRFPETGTLAGPSVATALSGTYDVGGGLQHYATPVDAANAVATAGLGGPVTFNVYSGTYDGQINLPNSIPELSATNTLTFQAAPGATPVITNTIGTTNTTGNGFYLTGADYVTIKGFEITNCYYTGIWVTYAGTDSAKYVTVEDNYIHDIAPASTGYGIYVYRGINCNVLNNQVQGDYYGIQIYYSQGCLIANNLIYGQDYYGLRGYYGGDNKYYYNSVYLNSDYGTTNYAGYFYNSAGCDLKNNIFYNGGSGSTTKYAIYLTSLATYPVTSNYNDLYSPNSSLGYYSSAQADLAAWQLATGLDANSISGDPGFVSVVAPYDLHIAAATSPVSNAGSPVTEVTVDFDYEARHATTPDIGGDEFTAGPVAPVEITMTPISPPITLPAVGGSFNFDVTLVNVSVDPQTTDAWIMVQLPTGTWYGPVLGPLELTLPVGASLTRQRTQNVPGGAPAGEYWYQGRVGVYPDTISDSSGFAFTKLTTGDGAFVSNWNNYGESFGV
ncbi:MAG: right-handed parallel beta-helix repeat-containing protein, partial [Candidatus Zixiibacteriota bacterium]